jgi:hypothetical protein
MYDERMTLAELLELPTTVDLETGNRAFGIGRSLGYKLAQRGEYPCKVIKAGGAYRIVTADLRRKLGAADLAEQSA